MTVAELAASAGSDPGPEDSLPDELKALWHARKGNWHEAHTIAQEIHTPMGSWIHALLHVTEGDQGNADYWFHRAGKPSRGPAETDALWMEIARALLPQ